MIMSTCVDQRRAGLAAAGGDLEDVLGQAALAQALGDQQRRQRRDLGRLEDHRVAGGQRRDAVAEGVRQRVVPRPDHADERRAGGSARRACCPSTNSWLDVTLLVGEVLGRVLGPEAERVGARRRSRRAARPRSVLPVSETIVSTIRSALSISHFCARGASRARGRRSRAPPTPAARRARARPARATASAPRSGTVRDDLAGRGVLDGILDAPCARRRRRVLGGLACSTVAIGSPLLALTLALCEQTTREPASSSTARSTRSPIGASAVAASVGALELVDDVHARR